ncbi:MAG: hypothetical protein GC190_18630 [Alphaproteobacteria bacterium]|nr:hypothetical protein [Alphaproteobacteria bacterium]
MTAFGRFGRKNADGRTSAFILGSTTASRGQCTRLWKRAVNVGLVVAAAFFASSTDAIAAPRMIRTGADLVSACEAFSKLDDKAMHEQMANATHPHHCHQFLMSFFSAFAVGDQAGRDARSSSLQGGVSGVCVHLPDFLSYRDMATRVVAQAKRDPSLLQAPAADLARKTIEHDFPCAPDRHAAP